MATEYHIYGNTGSGGPVDYTTVLATVSGLSWTTTAMAFGSDWTWAVRTYDTVSGLEDGNVDARVEIVIGAAGQDLSKLPNAPLGLAATATSGGTAKVSWAYNPGGQPSPPTGFHVYVGTPTPNYSTPAATVAYSSGQIAYRSSLSGLTDSTTYQVAVRAYNANGEESNTNTFSFVALATGPQPVVSLAAAIIS